MTDDVSHLLRLSSPFQGQTKARVMFDGAPGDGEFYVVLEGSALRHVTAAERRTDERDLIFTVPGRSSSGTSASSSGVVCRLSYKN